MVYRGGATGRVENAEIESPTAGAGQVLLKVRTCGVCRTDLHVVDGDLEHPKIPITPGHEVVGEVQALGAGVEELAIGDRVGVPWLGYSCGTCAFCTSGRENLCAEARYTGYQLDGGFAEQMVADSRDCFPLPEAYTDEQAAPLLCAGLIGHRAYRMAGDGEHLGLYGFGAAAHIVAQIAAWEGRKVYAFTRPGDSSAQKFAVEVGAIWAGNSTSAPPEHLDAAIIFAPVGSLLPEALAHTVPGGTVVCAGIHMSDIPSFPYRLLWEERMVRSVANLTRRDGREFLALAPRVPVRTHTNSYSLAEANRALDDLRRGRFTGAGVLNMPMGSVYAA
jgi:propanol-preferring alcohol dehydrogenase